MPNNSINVVLFNHSIIIDAGVTLVSAAASLKVATASLKAILAVYNLVTAADTINNAFRFPYSLSYSAYMSKVGWVYDETVFNDFVRYIGTTSSGRGVITLGWDIDSSNYRTNFRWVITSQPKYTDRPNHEVVNMTYDAYTGDIAYDGKCKTELYCVWNFGGEQV